MKREKVLSSLFLMTINFFAFSTLSNHCFAVNITKTQKFRQAIKECDLERIQTLHQAGADLKFAKGSRQDSPLHLAIREDCEAGALYIVDHLDEFDSKNKAGKTAMTLAADRQWDRVTNALVIKGALLEEDQNLDWAVERNLFTTIESMRINLNSQDACSANSLSILSLLKKKQFALAEQLIDENDRHDFDLDIVDSSGNSLLDLAAEENLDSLVLKLYLLGARVSKFKDGSWLHWGLTRKLQTSSDYFLTVLEDPTLSDSNKNTLLMTAIKFGREDIALQLVPEANNYPAKDFRGKTALDLSIDYDLPSVAASILLHAPKDMKIDKALTTRTFGRIGFDHVTYLLFERGAKIENVSEDNRETYIEICRKYVKSKKEEKTYSEFLKDPRLSLIHHEIVGRELARDPQNKELNQEYQSLLSKRITDRFEQSKEKQMEMYEQRLNELSTQKSAQFYRENNKVRQEKVRKAMGAFDSSFASAKKHLESAKSYFRQVKSKHGLSFASFRNSIKAAINSGLTAFAIAPSAQERSKVKRLFDDFYSSRHRNGNGKSQLLSKPPVIESKFTELKRKYPTIDSVLQKKIDEKGAKLKKSLASVCQSNCTEFRKKLRKYDNNREQTSQYMDQLLLAYLLDPDAEYHPFLKGICGDHYDANAECELADFSSCLDLAINEFAPACDGFPLIIANPNLGLDIDRDSQDYGEIAGIPLDLEQGQSLEKLNIDSGLEALNLDSVNLGTDIGPIDVGHIDVGPIDVGGGGISSCDAGTSFSCCDTY